MCLFKTPKVQPVGADAKDLPVVRNPLLDGLDPILRARSQGLSRLRIDRGTRRPSYTGAVIAPPTQASSGITLRSPQLPVSQQTGITINPATQVANAFAQQKLGSLN